MSSFNGFGFREVLIDQPFAGKWTDVDMNLGGGHSTFQGTKFSDFAGGFSYKNGSGGKQIVQNRCIYWRTLNDTLELTEVSMDYNLIDNQVRYIFQDSPIVGPITIQETESNVIILVATVTSVNRFIFTHPKRVQEMPSEKSSIMGNNKPSIFHQVCNKPQMNFRSFNLYEHTINIPVPLSAACYFIERGPSYNQGFQLSNSTCYGECVFAFSFESGSIHVYKISRDETLLTFDLRQSNMFARFLSGFTTSLLKAPTTSSDSVIGLSFFTAKGDRNKSLQLVTLSMNGQLRLWCCSNLDTFSEWTAFHCGVVHHQFAVDGYTDSSMLLRKNQDHDLNELPFFVVYIPGDSFKIYEVQKSVSNVNLGGSTTTQSKYELREARTTIKFKDRDIMDFSVTFEYLFLLVSNPEEETEWEIKSYNLQQNDSLNARFNLALLEPLPYHDVPMYPPSIEPKEFYMDLVFNKSSFSAQTIIKALTMYRKDEDEAIKDKDWDSLKITSMNMIDREIGLAASNSDYDIADDEYTELSLQFWLLFYNSCVEYHIHTVKPLGLFYESNTKMVCVVKKSRISFLRPTDFLETLYYFSNCVRLSDTIDTGEDQVCQMSLIIKYLEMIATLESTVDENMKKKMDRRLREYHLGLEEVCTEIAAIFTKGDPHCLILEQQHFIPMLAAKLRDLGEHGNFAMQQTLKLISTWDGEGESLNRQEDEEMDECVPQVTESFMASRVGAHLTFKILKQLMEHRFMLARDTMLLQALISICFSQNNDGESIQMTASLEERAEALAATTNYYAVLQLAEDTIDVVRPFNKERGLKIANILKIDTADHLKPETFADPNWPMKVIESFCLSQIGGLAIRSRVSSSKRSTILAYAEATGRSIWTNELTYMPHPFEDFLISACQYTILQKYANYLINYLTNAKLPIKNFYLGLSNLCLEEPEIGLEYFRSVTLKETFDDPYFSMKVLEVPLNQEGGFPASSHLGYFVKIISIFQIFELVPAIQQLAEDGYRAAVDEHSRTKMCSLAFKSAMKLEDYESGYKYIMLMEKERKERLASLRLFVSEILKRGEIEILINLDLNEMFNKTTSVREQVERILFAQANLSNPIASDGVYQMLYLYHLTKENYHKAADTMYYRAMKIGETGEGLEALEAQKDSYLDVITCLSLVQKDLRFVLQKSGIPPEQIVEGQVGGEDSSMIVRTYPDVKRELELCCMLLKLTDTFAPNPIKVFEFGRRAEQAIDCLTINHFYDNAIKLAELWNVSVVPIISTFADVCSNLVFNILPQGGDPAEYIRNNDISELPNSNTGVIEIAFKLLESYLNRLEKPKESVLHEQVVLKFLAATIELPQWLVASYKKRNTAQLLRCYIRYGEWDEATQLAVKVIDASLGRRRCDEFDPSIKKISAYDPVEPVLPFKDINVLAGQMKARISEQPELQTLYDLLSQRTTLFCDRVLECTNERTAMFAQRMQF